MTEFKTRQEAAHARLRSDILVGRFLPGQRLRCADLCERYDVSVGVIREALSRLLEQGLVESRPQHGFFVTSLSAESLIQLTRARVEIETLTLRMAIENGDVAWEADVLAAHHHLSQTPQVDDSDARRLSEEWAGRHAAFHHTLLAGCGNDWLLQIADELRASAELYRQWSVTLVDSTGRDIAAEHRALSDAVLIRDQALATQLLESHISLTTELLLAALKNSGEADSGT